MVSGIDFFVVVAYYCLLIALAIYGMHRFHLVRLLRRHGAATDPAPPALQRWPDVTVQLPAFNEPHVVERLLDAAARLEYPGHLEIQLLDDSTDETSELAERKIAELRARGAVIHHLRRTDRSGFKAGALSAGLNQTGSELLVVFDADFVPSTDLLLRMIPWFADPGVGMVQARWEHLNRTDSALTRVQAIYLDAHFAIESAARHISGRFFNFNGTAGIWRRQAIIDAGGWSSSTVTEDLDLSYRAQLAGWKFVFLPAVTVPGEVPASLNGFQEQQYRWVKGSMQTARKLLPAILKSSLPWRVRTEAFFHLTNNTAYPMTLLLALLLVPSLLIRERMGLGWTLAVDVLLFASSTVPVLLFYLAGQRRIGRKAGLREMLCVLPIGVGLSIRNSAAVLEGLLRRGGAFHRTPKQGDMRAAATLARAPHLPVAESLLAAFFMTSVIVLGAAGHLASLPFLFLFLGGFAYVSVAGTLEIAVRKLRFF
ncbi:MAG TPA: glycosyltransferase [Thermoanaerobaculia bacterium]|nr:glycosyltransferase [Thermoanaerobaculia bacterium]